MRYSSNNEAVWKPKSRRSCSQLTSISGWARPASSIRDSSRVHPQDPQEETVKYLLPLMLVVVLLLSVSQSALAQEEITFLAPRPVQGPIAKLIKEFEAKTNYKVKATW